MDAGTTHSATAHTAAQPTPPSLRCPHCGAGEAKRFRVMGSDVADWTLWACGSVVYADGIQERGRACKRRAKRQATGAVTP